MAMHMPNWKGGLCIVWGLPGKKTCISRKATVQKTFLQDGYPCCSSACCNKVAEIAEGHPTLPGLIADHAKEALGLLGGLKTEIEAHEEEVSGHATACTIEHASHCLQRCLLLTH
jgi:hypothetical protein